MALGTLEKSTTSGPEKETLSFSSKLHDALVQRNTPNMQLRDLYLKLWSIYGGLERSNTREAAEDHSLSDDTLRSLLKINKVITTTDVNTIETLAKKMLNKGSDAIIAIIPNRTKIDQYTFLKETYKLLGREIQGLQKKLQNPNIQYVIKNAFNRGAKITQAQKDDTSLFLSELPSIMNDLVKWKAEILTLCSHETKEYIEKHYREDHAYYPEVKL